VTVAQCGALSVTMIMNMAPGEMKSRVKLMVSGKNEPAHSSYALPQYSGEASARISRSVLISKMLGIKD
jgi:hypothetical protein